MNYSQLIKQKSRKFGFQSWGISKANFWKKKRRLETCLIKLSRRNEIHGKSFRQRLNPTLLVDGAKSVISFHIIS